jgi:SPW repeat-containing protein
MSETDGRGNSRCESRGKENAVPNELAHEKRVRLLDGANAVLGLWLIVSPFVIGAPGQNVATGGIVVGVLVLLLAIARVTYKRTVAVGLSMALLGAWTIMSPYVLGSTSPDFRTFNYVIVGIIIAGLEAYSLTSSVTQPNWRQRQSGPR